MEGTHLKKLIIYGNGTMAALVHEFVRHDYEIECFTVDEACISGEEELGLPLIPFEKLISRCDPSEFSMLIAVGFVEMNAVREKKYLQASSMGYSFINYIHPSVVKHDNLVFGENNIVLDHVSLHPGTTLGNSVFISSGSVVGHGCTIGDSNWINSGVSIAGGCEIGPACFFGVNSSLGQGVRLGSRTFVGANTMISKNTDEDEVHISEPGQKFRLKSDAFLRFARLP